MNTLKQYYLNGAESKGTWGYISEGVATRLGRRHYAEEICKERGHQCVQLEDVVTESAEYEQQIQIQSANGFMAFLLK